jgi:hypothetical protein
VHRRNFLTALGLGAAGLVLDPELLTWRKGARSFFLPSLKPAQYRVVDAKTGISMRFIQHFDIDTLSGSVDGFDMLCAMPQIPDAALEGQAKALADEIDRRALALILGDARTPFSLGNL